MKAGDVLQLHIDNFGVNGEGVARYEGMAVFVPFAIRDEDVTARITYVHKSFADAKLLKIINSSPCRRTPECRCFEKCGGCDLQHISYETQLKLKTQTVSDCLRRIAGLPVPVDECVGSDNEWAYRNKISLPVGYVNGKLTAGFYAERSHSIVPLVECPIHPEWAVKLTDTVIRWAERNHVTAYDEKSHTGILRHIVARQLGGRLMITVVIAVPYDKINGLAKEIFGKFPDSAVYVNINTSQSNVIMSGKVKLLYGTPVIADISGIKYEAHPMSFSQVNDGVRDKIYARVCDEIDGGTVIDAYSGGGVLTCLMAKHADKVYGIEIVSEAVADADKTKHMNGLDGKVENINGDCAKHLPELVSELKSDNLTVVLDPPRKGCDGKVTDALLNALPDKIVYVSCNPATLARDLGFLKTAYTVTSVTPYDMFPQTKHVETLVCLKRKC